MKFSALLISTVAQVATAHYFWDRNTILNVDQPAYKYVLESTRPTKYNPIKFSVNPTADIRDGSFVDGPDIRCNQGAFKNSGKTDVLTVNAGDKVSLKLAVGAKMGHPGPEFVYMSLAPGSVKNYDGSGEWFKIHEEGVCDGGDFTSTAWCDYNRNYIAATIPKDTPNGEYLVRVEHIGVHRSHVNQPEHYVACMQVKVVNGGNGKPGPTVKFPGAYKPTDPYANFSIYNGRKAFPMPGPAVWTGGASGNNTAGANDVSPAPAPAAKPSTMSTVKVPATKPTTTSSSTPVAAAPVVTPAPAAGKPVGKPAGKPGCTKAHRK